MNHRNLPGFLNPMLRAAQRAPHERWLAGVVGALAPVLAFANPTGGQVVAGSATIGSVGSNGVIVNQNSQRAAINWQQFSIGANEYVQFNQPNSSSVVLNRVTGSNPSSIFGQIRANGQVFLINPNGILFAPGSSLDVSGLTASTLDISDADFMAGRYVFSKDSGAPDTTVVNQGSITVTRGGYVVLAGDYVENDGVINAVSGKVLLAAGGGATLTLDNSGDLISFQIDAPTLARLAGVTNTGEITANGGTVLMTADVANALTATAVNNSGLITAHSVRQQGGEILLLAHGGDIENSGTLDASATQDGVAGGTVIVHAKGGDTELTDTSEIAVTGQGAPGGFVDVSGHELTLKGALDIGKGGHLLLDPSTVRIEGSAGSNSQCSGCEGGVIHTNFIDHELNDGVDLTIVASSQIIVGSGHLGAGPATAITALIGTGKLSLKIGRASFNTLAGSLHSITGSILSNGTPKNEIFSPISGGTINITGVTVNIKGDFIASASKGTVILGAVTARNIAITGTSITTGNLKANAGTASSGTIQISATGPGNKINTGTLTANQKVMLLASNGSLGQGSISVGQVNAGGEFSAHAGNSVGIGGTLTIRSAATAGGIINLIGNTITTADLHDTGHSRNLTISADGKAGGQAATIKTGNITADGRVSIVTGGSNSGSIAITGNIKASGDITLENNQAANAGAKIKVTGAITGAGSAITIEAKGGGAHGASVNLTGGAITSTGRSLHISADDLDSIGGARVKVTGAMTGIKNVVIQANGGADSVSVGAINIDNVCHGDCSLDSVNVSANGGTVKVGTITAGVSNESGAFVRLEGRNIKFGDIDAGGGDVSIRAAGAQSGGTAITQTAGKTITARIISVDLTASYGGNVTLGNLVASSAAAPAMVTVDATDRVHGNTKIVVGSITVSGKASNGRNSSGLIDFMPVAAVLDMRASGAGASGSHTVRVTGAITIKATANNFNVSHASSCDCSRHQETTLVGNGGVAAINIAAEGGAVGAVSIGGAIALTGPDAFLNVVANTVNLANVSVTGVGHNVTTTVKPGSGSNFNLSSHNSAGQAVVRISGLGSADALNVTTGNITVNGKGVAQVQVDAAKITTGDVTVAAIAAKGSRNASGHIVNCSSCSRSAGLSSNGFYRDFHGSGSLLGKVKVDMGNASVMMGEIFPGNRLSSAQTLTVGNISVTGVGEAEIDLAGATMQTKNLTATATKGTLVGNSSSSSSVRSIKQKRTFNIDDGQANINLFGGNAAGNTIKVIGAISSKGPSAGVSVLGNDISVTGNVSAIGSGGGAVSSSANVSSGANHYKTKFTGAGNITGVSFGRHGAAASVSIGGTVTAKGPGLIAVLITADKVTLGGLSASASATAKYSVLDTRVSTTVDTFTAGSVVAIVDDFANGKISGPATVTGDVTMNAVAGSVYIPSEWAVGGQVKLNASGNITTDVSKLAPEFNAVSNTAGHDSGGGNSNSSNGVPVAATPAFSLKAAGVSMAAGGSIDLTGATITTSGTTTLKAGDDIVLTDATVTATGVMALNAGKDIILGGVTLTTGGLSAIAGGSIDLTGATATATGVMALKAAKDIILSDVTLKTGTLAADAGSTIHNGGAIGTITTKALALVAGKNINLSSTHINVGSGVVAPVTSNAALTAMFADPVFAAAVTGDPTLLGGLAAAGLSPAASAPNAVFQAGNTVTLGTLNLTGSYLYLQAGSITLLGPVTVPKGAVVQLTPNGVVGSTDAEGTGAAGADLNLNDNGLFNVFPDGITLVLGGAGQSGDVTLGSHGPFHIGSDNLIVDTSGTVTGLGNVISTGQVVSLSSLLTGVPPVTAGEIDPTSNTNSPNTDKDKHQQGADANGTDTGTGGTISQDTGNSSVCH